MNLAFGKSRAGFILPSHTSCVCRVTCAIDFSWRIHTGSTHAVPTSSLLITKGHSQNPNPISRGHRKVFLRQLVRLLPQICLACLRLETPGRWLPGSGAAEDLDMALMAEVLSPCREPVSQPLSQAFVKGLFPVCISVCMSSPPRGHGSDLFKCVVSYTCLKYKSYLCVFSLKKAVIGAMFYAFLFPFYFYD